MNVSRLRDDPNDDSDGIPRSLVISSIVANRWVWISSIVSAIIGVWIFQQSGRLAGTAWFYTTLFTVGALLLVGYGGYRIRRRIQVYRYGNG